MWDPTVSTYISLQMGLRLLYERIEVEIKIINIYYFYSINLYIKNYYEIL